MAVKLLLKVRSYFLFQSTTSTHSRTLRHLFATLHVRRLSRIFNRNACVYQTAIRWDLPPYPITIWVIEWWCNVCLFTWWIDTRFLLERFDIGNRWIWTLIDYHLCITSEPTNQARSFIRTLQVIISKRIVSISNVNFWMLVLMYQLQTPNYWNISDAVDAGALS